MRNSYFSVSEFKTKNPIVMGSCRNVVEDKDYLSPLQMFHRDHDRIQRIEINVNPSSLT